MSAGFGTLAEGMLAGAFLAAWTLLIGLWLGYPAVIAVCAALRRYRPRRHGRSRDARTQWPTVSVIISAHNEAAVIAQRIENLWAQSYPAERVEILVSEDGSGDGTAGVVRELIRRGGPFPLRLLSSSDRLGKAGAINRAAAVADGEVLVFTDANNLFSPGALRHLAAPFADREVGAVVGRKTVSGEDGVGGGESVYWKYEGWLTRQESRAGSVAAAFGEVLAVRRTAFVPLPQPTGLAADDVYLMLQVLAQRLRVVAAPRAQSVEAAAATDGAEWERRRRMAAGRWAALATLRGRWRRLGMARGLQVLCHQVLRPISALWLGLALLAGFGVLLAPGATRALRGAAELQTLGLAALVAIGGLRRCGARLGRLEAPYFFCLALAAALAGWWRYWRGSQPALWQRVPRADASSGSRPAVGPGAGTRGRDHQPDGVSAAYILRGLFWASSSFVAGKLLVFGSVLVLARLLAPRAFGEVALATSALMVLEIFGTLGLTSALIFEEQHTGLAANFCFWTTLAAGVIESAIAWPLAPRLAAYFHEPELGPMLRVLLAALIFTMLGNTHDTLLRRRLAFRTKLAPDVGQAAAKSLASVALAIAGWGAWSLIWGQVAGTAVAAAVLWKVTGWRPQWRFDRGVTRRMIAYARHIYLLDTSSVLLTNLDTLFIGRMLSDVWLGFYTLAFRIPEVVLLSVLNVITRVVFPAFSRLQNDASKLRATVLDTARYTAILTLPLAAGIGLLARPIVFGLYGRHWGASVAVLQVLALYAGLRVLTHHFGDAYKAIGRPDVLTRTTIAWWMLLPPSLWLGARWGGIVGVAWGEVATRMGMSTLHVYLIWRFLRISPRKLVRCFTPAVEATAVMAAAVVGMDAICRRWTPRWELATVVPVGAAVYGLALLWRHPRVVGAAVRQIRGRMPRAAGGSLQATGDVIIAVERPAA